MEQRKFLLVPMLIFILLALVLFSCDERHSNSTITSDKTISITKVEPIISRVYYTTSDGLQIRDVSSTPKPEDLDFLDYWTITFKSYTDSLILSCKGANGELNDIHFKYKFEDGYLKVFNAKKPLWEIIGYGDRNRVSFFVDFVVYRNATGPFWVSLDFCPDITIEDALRLNEQDLFSTISDITLGNIASYYDLHNCNERIYWRLIAYILE